jgi:hypothetical protein
MTTIIRLGELCDNHNPSFRTDYYQSLCKFWVLEERKISQIFRIGPQKLNVVYYGYKL